MRNTNMILRPAIVILLALAAPAAMAQVTWDGGGGDSDWANPLNWSGDSVPLPGDVVHTDGAADLTARSVTVDAAGEYYLQNFTGAIGTLAVGAEGSGWAEVTNATLGCDILQIGLFEGSSGAMAVQAMQAGRVSVGASGLGFLQLDGQMTSHAGTVGLFPRSSGEMLVTQFGKWTCEDLTVGQYGDGNLSLEPGAEVVADTAIIGFGEGVNGSVSLSNGARFAATDALMVGYSGTGSMEVTNAGQVECGMAVIGGKWELMEPGAGTVTVSDGSTVDLTGDLFVGASGTGSMTVSGSSEVTFNDAYVGYMPDAAGDLTLDGQRTKWCGTNAFIGGYTRGTVTMLDTSELVLSGRLYLGYYPGGEGVLVLGDSASVKARDVYLGGEAVEGSLQEGDPVALHRRDGRIDVTGAARIQCWQSFTVGACGAMTATPGSGLQVEIGPTAGFANESTDAAALDGLRAVTLDCIAGEPWTTIEVAAADDGPAVPGLDLTGRFALAGLTLDDDGAVMLVDDCDNQLDNDAAEALYVDTLTLGVGSTLDLNGLSLYYRTLIDNGGTIVPNGGTVAQIYAAGDVDGDGDVDLDDFAILKQNFGTASGATRAEGDMNGDGAVDLDDFVILKRNFGYAQP